MQNQEQKCISNIITLKGSQVGQVDIGKLENIRFDLLAVKNKIGYHRK
jgi:predicted porin